MPSFSSQTPTISVVVVNYNGRDYLENCLGSLFDQAYDPERVEVIFVDNASSDGSVEFVRGAFPAVRVLQNTTNTGFSPAVNQGAKVASGEYLALINNDAEADPDWLATASAYLQQHDTVGCVASKILRSDRQTIDYAGGELAFYGHGYARDLEQPEHSAPGYAERTLFPSGGAMITRTALFLDVGGFDESYFAFFEDVDYGWRLWIMGHEVHYLPSSKVFHKHHGTIERFGYARERYLLERNALATVFKNYGEENLARTLPPTLLLTLVRGMRDLPPDADLPDFAITEGAKPLDSERIEISGLTAAHLAAVRDFATNLDLLRAKRREVQARRVRRDEEILPLFRQTLRPNVDGPEYLDVFRKAVEAFNLEEQLTHQPNILILTADTISERMAGPAIRCWEMASVLSAVGQVTLASTTPPSVDISGPGRQVDFELEHLRPGMFQALYAEADVVVFQGFIMHDFPELASGDKPLVVDMYDPFHLEGLTLRKHEPDVERYVTAQSDIRVVNHQLERGDFFVCASEQQRDFWLGQLSALRRINPATFDADESLRRLIDVAPFGLPSEPPVRSESNLLRGGVDGIGEDDFLLVWGGGIYNWFDPLTLIRAVGMVADTHPEVKLWFMGSAHPNPAVPKMKMAARAHQLADRLGLLGKHVFFNEGWVDYRRRQNYLLDADVGVSTHYEHLETKFSFRTRILDYIWCGLPILATEGDALSLLTKDRGLGVTVPPEDVDAVVAGILRLREDKEFYATCHANLEALAPEMTWDKALAPVVEFCRNPVRAADFDPKPYRYITSENIVLRKSLFHYAKRVAHYYQTAGPDVALLHVRNFLRKRLAR